MARVACGSKAPGLAYTAQTVLNVLNYLGLGVRHARQHIAYRTPDWSVRHTKFARDFSRATAFPRRIQNRVTYDRTLFHNNNYHCYYYYYCVSIDVRYKILNISSGESFVNDRRASRRTRDRSESFPTRRIPHTHGGGGGW